MKLGISLIVFSLVAGSFAATVTFNCDKLPSICSNDCYAIGCLGMPSLLHRDSKNAAAHRKKNACKSPNYCNKRPDGLISCDEYPFASSAESGAGAVTRYVSQHENSVQGGTLSSFYNQYSITNGDGYNVAFTSNSDLQYCDGNCENAGNEVQRRYPVSAVNKRRVFMSDEGHELVMFEPVSQPGHLDSLVGTKTWLAVEEREVTIVRALE